MNKPVRKNSQIEKVLDSFEAALRFVVIGFGTVFLAVAVAGVWSAWAADINFHFNNVEQGSHSTASPRVVINGKKTEKQVTTEQVTTEQVTTEENQSLAAEDGSAVELVQDRPIQPTFFDQSEWRFSLETSHFLSDPSLSIGTNGLGGALGIQFQPSRYVALQGSLGLTKMKEGNLYGSLDAQLYPFHFTLFDRDLIDLGAVVGLSSLGDRSVSVHGGVHAQFNLGKSLGLSATVKGNKDFVLGLAGLNFKL